MRISVECGGYAEAASVCRTANHVSALVTESLAGKLGAYAAMAGDDATSIYFAGSYDPAAREAVATLADLTHALIGLGRLVDASGRAHGEADAGAATTVYSGRGIDDDAFVRVAPAPPPSCLGGSVASELGDGYGWILDQVEGFVWPGADVDLLRDAAATWRRTSGSVADLTAHLDAVTRLLDRQRSPEIPLAMAAIADLRRHVEDASDQLVALADACDDYATAVEEARARTRSLLVEIGQMIVEEVAITAIVAGITGGLGGGVKAAAALARIRAQSPRFHALLTALRAVATASASRLRVAEEQLRRARAGFERFVRVPARNERGEMLFPGGWRTNLRGQDELGGHIASRHVGKSLDELADRARSDGIPYASSFANTDDAEKAIENALRLKADELSTWLAGDVRKKRLNVVLDHVTGTSVDAAGSARQVRGVRLILVRADTPSGYRILTAFPQP
ncbi:hypothetical protein ASG76_01435 [Nocardioides sp. Soil774]|uniref:RNase A-like domain-containing protein n=1 Tax=Nocardioides sp. Soil774 TaxID=1736408 RepID=UPI0006F8E0F0|nr:RNase A-like domain-containing protein [Nocardioides sp. Soil774]KRE97414.1 hypothetical protein ASG76_01435 [Nocardioides sp. Soil774]